MRTEANRVAGVGARGVNLTSDPQDLGAPDLAILPWTPSGRCAWTGSSRCTFDIGASVTGMTFYGKYPWESHADNTKLAIGGTLLFISNTMSQAAPRHQHYVLLKGHAAMIYERFGKWWGRFSLFDLLLVNFLTLITEFAAISLALSALGVNPWISVPVSALGLTMLVVTGSYLRWERMVIALCLMDLTWFALAYMVHPNWSAVGRATIIPAMPVSGITSSLVFLVIAIVGTTIAPWQLFFQQSCVAEKRLRFPI